MKPTASIAALESYTWCWKSIREEQVLMIVVCAERRRRPHLCCTWYDWNCCKGCHIKRSNRQCLATFLAPFRDHYRVPSTAHGQRKFCWWPILDSARSTYRSIYLAIYLSSYLSMYLSSYLSMYLCIRLSIYLSIHPSTHAFRSQRWTRSSRPPRKRITVLSIPMYFDLVNPKFP